MSGDKCHASFKLLIYWWYYASSFIPFGFCKPRKKCFIPLYNPKKEKKNSLSRKLIYNWQKIDPVNGGKLTIFWRFFVTSRPSCWKYFDAISLTRLSKYIPDSFIIRSNLIVCYSYIYHAMQSSKGPKFKQQTYLQYWNRVSSLFHHQ